jgi:hypothetical protein
MLNPARELPRARRHDSVIVGLENPRCSAGTGTEITGLTFAEDQSGHTIGEKGPVPPPSRRSSSAADEPVVRLANNAVMPADASNGEHRR